MRRIFSMLMICVLVFLLASCVTPAPEATPESTGVKELAVTTISLTGPVSKSSAEVSGMAWYGDHLILLPQYPKGALYALPKAAILAFLDGSSAESLEPIRVPFVDTGLTSQIDDFEGYEAIAFAGDQVFLTIEASPGDGMMGYAVFGQMAPDLSLLTVDTDALVEIPPQSGSANKSDEILLLAGERLVTIYEVNGAGVNASPVAHLFDLSLAPAGTISLPNVEYRLTDATILDGEDRFWTINYFYPGDSDLLPETDPLAERYGEGPTHVRYEPVERLVEFQYSESGIELVERPPLQLELLPDDEARNWEGIVRLDGRGFLLITDKFPETILGFVEYVENE